MRALLLVTLGACTFNSTPPTSSDLGGSRSVRGEIVDFKTGQPVSGASLEVSGLAADVTPSIVMDGARFEIEGVIENSTFQLKANATSYRPTFGPSITVAADDVFDVRVPVVSVAYLEGLVAGFDVEPPTQGILIARLVQNGIPAAGVGATSFMMPGGPHFVDANLEAVSGGQVTSASGTVVFFDVPAGVTGMVQPTAPPVALDMADSPVEAGSVTLAEVTVLDSPVAVPTNVSFANIVHPIFERRGCVACHSGKGDGKNLGGLKLDGGTKQVYTEVNAVGRINQMTPEASRLLTYPSRESPPDRHPNITFASKNDPDYISMLVWIREGAREN